MFEYGAARVSISRCYGRPGEPAPSISLCSIMGPSLRSLIAAESAIHLSQYRGLRGTSNTGPFMSMVERGWAWPARSSPQPPEAEARKAWLEGAGHAHHNRQRDDGAGAAPKRGSCMAGVMVLSAVGWYRRNMASGEDRRADVPNAVTAAVGRNGGNGIAEPRPGRDRFPSERGDVRPVRPPPSGSSGTLVRPSTCDGGQPPASSRPRPWLCARRSAWPAPRPTP